MSLEDNSGYHAALLKVSSEDWNDSAWTNPNASAVANQSAGAGSGGGQSISNMMGMGMGMNLNVHAGSSAAAGGSSGVGVGLGGMPLPMSLASNSLSLAMNSQDPIVEQHRHGQGNGGLNMSAVEGEYDEFMQFSFQSASLDILDVSMSQSFAKVKRRKKRTILCLFSFVQSCCHSSTTNLNILPPPLRI
jgi:hypothetical protein